MFACLAEKNESKILLGDIDRIALDCPRTTLLPWEDLPNQSDPKR